MAGTYGVVTSAIVKAYPSIQILASSLSFSTSSINSSSTQPPGGSNATATETFWRGFDLYHKWGLAIVDNGGTAYSYVSSSGGGGGGSGGFTFRTDIEVPGMTEDELFDFVQPLYDGLNAIGIRANNSRPAPASNWGFAGATGDGTGDAPGSSRFASRLFPRANFEEPLLFAATQVSRPGGYGTGNPLHFSSTPISLP